MKLKTALILAVAAVAVTVVGVSLALRSDSAPAQAAGAMGLAGEESHGSQGSGSGNGYGSGGGSGNGLGSGNGPGSGERSDSTHVVVTGTYALSDPDADEIAYMREEEKLAHDVYVVLAEEWGLRAFSNISSSESQHMDAVKELIDAYDLSDPAATTAAGEFQEEGLQELYDELVEKGRTSLTDALEVGILIEETDIADLERAIEATDNPEVSGVFSNLLSASQRHLVSFERLLERHAD